MPVLLKRALQVIKSTEEAHQETHSSCSWRLVCTEPLVTEATLPADERISLTLIVLLLVKTNWSANLIKINSFQIIYLQLVNKFLPHWILNWISNTSKYV